MGTLLDFRKELASEIMTSLGLRLDEMRWLDSANLPEWAKEKKKLAEKAYFGSKFSEDILLLFQRWENAKPAYLVLHHRRKTQPLFELDMSLIAEIGNVYTCYLRPRRNPVNLGVLESYALVENISPQYRTVVRSNQLEFGLDRTSAPSRGYCLAERASQERLKSNLIDLFLKLIEAHGGPTPSSRDNYDPDSLEAYEGYESDVRIMQRTRDLELAARRKRKDDYMCQVCGFKLEVDDKFVIECHHLNPISSGYRKTQLKDLISLCPTCHRIAHLAKPPYTLQQIELLWKLVDRKGKN